MMKTIQRTLLFISIFFLVKTSIAQENLIFQGSKHKIGFVVGYGAQRLNQVLTDPNNSNHVGLNVKYDYKVLFFQGQYYYSLLRKPTWSLELLAQPQFNLTRYKPTNDSFQEIHGYEYGLNIGLLIRKNFFHDFLSLYAFIGSGPHYVNGTPNRQASGFIFSDNFFVGCNLKLFHKTYLDIRPGFRHISNAGLKHPNGGVNDFVLSGGIMIVL